MQRTPETEKRKKCSVNFGAQCSNKKLFFSRVLLRSRPDLDDDQRCMPCPLKRSHHLSLDYFHALSAWPSHSHVCKERQADVKRIFRHELVLETLRQRSKTVNEARPLHRMDTCSFSSAQISEPIATGPSYLLCPGSCWVVAQLPVCRAI